jgi:hypothetical protein
MMIKDYRKKIAVSEVVGVILLLAISIALFSIVNFIVFTYPFSPPSSSVNLLATIDDEGDIIKIKHNYGDPLDLKTKIIVIGDTSIDFEADGNIINNIENIDHWNIGEIIEIDITGMNPNPITDKYTVMIFDYASNNMIMKTDLQR